MNASFCHWPSPTLGASGPGRRNPGEMCRNAGESRTNAGDLYAREFAYRRVVKFPATRVRKFPYTELVPAHLRGGFLKMIDGVAAQFMHAVEVQLDQNARAVGFHG